MQKLAPNMVLRWELGDQAPSLERLLIKLPVIPAKWAVISLDSDGGLPTSRSAAEILKGFESGIVTEVDDPFGYLRGLTDNDLTEAQKTVKDERWRIVGPLVLNRGSHPLLHKETRGKVVQELHAQHQIPVPKLYDWIHRFYQRGQTEFALVPDFQNCGARGETRGCTELKRGRPPKHGKQVVNITPEIAKKLCQGLLKFHRDEGLPFEDALIKTKQVYFFQRWYMDGSRKVYVLKPEAELITTGQARHHYLRNLKLPALTRQRLGAKRYDKDVRGITGDSTLMAWGPGALYMIDSTIADTWLRHPWTHKPIGRPTVYLVIDVYTHMVVGFHVTFEPPSLIAAALAIEQAIRSKAEVIKELGLEIHEELWPAEGIPSALLADRGELISKDSDEIPRILRCDLETTQAYRGDAKGLVEQAFRQTNLHTIQWTDGFVSKDRDRDEPHPKRTTTVHPRAFCQVLAVGLINRNFDLLDRYPLAKEHYGEGLERRPFDLWNWGMDNQSGLLRPINTKHLHRKLLPRATAKTERNGLFFRGVSFTNKRLDEEDWFSLAGIQKRKYVAIAYDPRSVSNTYLVPNELEGELEPLQLTARWRKRDYGDLSWHELETLFKQDKATKAASCGKDLVRKINARAYQEQILEASKAHFNDGKALPADDTGVKENFRKQEFKYGGAEKVPLTPPGPESSNDEGKRSYDSDDEEHAEIAEQLLKSLRP